MLLLVLSVTTFMVRSTRADHRPLATRSDLRILCGYVAVLNKELHGNPPSDFAAFADGLAALSNGPDISDLSRDGWGRHYRFTVIENGDREICELRSCGPDGKFDTPDDIVQQCPWHRR